MKIAGFQKQSFIDFPGNISSVIFTQGCNFRCPYCHNPELVLPKCYSKLYSTDEIFNYISFNNSLLDAVCISGGEPTLHSDLPSFIQRIKALNLKVKLDTNGTNFGMLKHLIDNNLLDFVAMDIKHLLNFSSYNFCVGNVLSENSFNEVLKSINLIEESNIGYQFRTTIAKGLHSKSDVLTLKSRFTKSYLIQNFKSENVLSNESKLEPFFDFEFSELEKCEVL